MCTTAPGENFCFANLLACSHKNQLNFIWSTMPPPLSSSSSSSSLLPPRFRSLTRSGNGLRQEIHKALEMQLFHSVSSCCAQQISCQHFLFLVLFVCHFIIWFISDKNVKFEIKCFWTSFSICLVQTCDNIWVYLLLDMIAWATETGADERIGKEG